MKNLSTIKGELTVYGPIADSDWWGDEVTPKQFQSDLKALGDISELDIRINSGGGSVFAGQTIYALLKSHKAFKTVYIDGLAASIASIIAMAGDKVVMHEGSMLMIHNPWSSVWGGDAEEFRQTAELLDKIKDALVNIYATKTFLTTDKIRDLMDEETWMTADEAVMWGFANEVTDFQQIAASIKGDDMTVNGVTFDMTKYRHRPKITDSATSASTKNTVTKEGTERMKYEEILNGLPEEQRQVMVEALTVAVNAKAAEMQTTIDGLQQEVENLKQAAPPVEPTVEDMLANADPKIVAMINLERERATAAEAEANALKQEKELAAFTAVVVALDKLPVNAEKLAPVFRNFAAADKEGYEELKAVLIAANNMLDSSALFTEVGSSVATAPKGTAVEQLEAAAIQIAQASNISKEKAFVEACKTNPDLYQQYVNEMKTKEGDQ